MLLIVATIYGNQNNKSIAQINVFFNLSLFLHILINDPKNKYILIATTIPPNHSVLDKIVNANINKITDITNIIG